MLPEARSLLSGILNEDISNRGRAFLERSEQVLGMLQIMQNQYHFEREFDHMLSSLVDILSSYRQKVQRINTDGQRVFECRRKHSGKPGRPAYSISYYQVEGLVSLGFTWKRIAEIMCVSERTLPRWRQEFAFDVPFSEMENEALDDIVAKQLQSCSSMGERMLAGALRSQGLWSQRQRLRESIMRVDPLGTRILRRFQVMQRQVHKVEGPKALWYVDSIFPLTDPALTSPAA